MIFCNYKFPLNYCTHSVKALLNKTSKSFFVRKHLDSLLFLRCLRANRSRVLTEGLINGRSAFHCFQTGFSCKLSLDLVILGTCIFLNYFVSMFPDFSESSDSIDRWGDH